MKNRGVFSTSPRLPGMAHKTGGRPESLAGQIAAPVVPDVEAETVGFVPKTRELPPPAPPGEASALKPPSAAAPSAKRKYSLSLRIEADLVARCEQVLQSYPVTDHASIRRGIATMVREALAQNLLSSPSRNQSQLAHSTVRLDLRLDAEIVQALGRVQDPYGLMPVTTMIARAVEPVYADVLRNLLGRATKPPT